MTLYNYDTIDDTIILKLQCVLQSRPTDFHIQFSHFYINNFFIIKIQI